MNKFLQRFGWVQLPKNRSILLCVPGRNACGPATELLAVLSREQQRTSFFFIAGDEIVARWLSENIPAVPVLSFPINVTPTAMLFLLLARVRLIIAFEHPCWVPSRLTAKAFDLGIPMIVSRCTVSQEQLSATSCLRTARQIDWWEPMDDSVGQRLAAIGIAAEKIGRAANETSGFHGKNLAILRGLSARRPPLRRPLQRLILRGLENHHFRKLIGWRVRRIETIDAFRDELGSPRTIMCLGNGPSCEDTALDEHRYDTLFRVNYRWISRGKFLAPDVVFTGQKRTLFTVRPRFFAFQTRTAEGQLVTHQIFNPLCGRMNYVTLGRLGILSGETWDSIRPTNGATMIATAVALQPQRLIIGGIDLFEDPTGAYPGDSTTPNAYVPVHDPAVELKFILEILHRFRGELIIIGDVLKAKFKEYAGSIG